MANNNIRQSVPTAMANAPLPTPEAQAEVKTHPFAAFKASTFHVTTGKAWTSADKATSGFKVATVALVDPVSGATVEGFGVNRVKDLASGAERWTYSVPTRKQGPISLSVFDAETTAMLKQTVRAAWLAHVKAAPAVRDSKAASRVDEISDSI